MKLGVTVAALLLAFGAQAAEKCALPQLASLTLKPLADGRYAVPVTIGGAEHDFALGLSIPFSAIAGPLADAQGFETKKLPRGIDADVGGEAITQQVTVAAFAIGGARAKDFHMMRVDRAQRGVEGVVGLDLLENFDVELDLKNDRLNLFSQEHCAGNVVYWAQSYAEVPFATDKSGHVAFSMKLDDRKLAVDLDAREGPSTMSDKTLERIFDMKTDAPGMVAEKQPWGTLWHYPFKTLSLEGLIIANPRIAIVAQDGRECRPETRWVNGRQYTCYGASDLHLRASVIKALHLYFAFKEKTLYVTQAE